MTEWFRKPFLCLIGVLVGCGGASSTTPTAGAQEVSAGAERRAETEPSGDCPQLEPVMTFSGRVVDQSGAPIEGARISAMWSNVDTNPCAHRAVGIRDIQTPADGSFSMQLPRLGVRLRFSHEQERIERDPLVDGYRYETVEFDIAWRHGSESRMDVVLGRHPCHMEIVGHTERCI
ncbi:MAG TPA: carboxypeptidase-like regulatory domain-containing protein [Sandaracinaceae bacterium LLY-WYZ-13_1]|nr:carboxypeptidase-like regulatory domain-containing protein [Sandaracinaceae bacterium LLY-WYZ-13_1]